MDEVRSSFTVYLVASDLADFEGLAESLGLAGYMVASFSELTAAFSELPSNPPHLLIFDANERRFPLAATIEQVAAQLPESHIFLLTPLDQRTKFVDMLNEGVYDLIYTPLVSPVEVLRALDRAAERDYFMYMSERLSETARAPEAEEITRVTENAPIPVGPVADGFARNLFDAPSADVAITVFLRAVSVLLGGTPAVYFKYVANRRVLMASMGVGIDDVGNLGVDFNRSADFRSAHLRDPMGIPEIGELASGVFQSEEYFALPIEALGDLQGLALFLAPQPGGVDAQMVHEWLKLLQKALGLIEAEKRLHVSSVKDPVTDLLNRQTFIGRIDQEISRARRLNMPVSLCLIAVDPFEAIASEIGSEEAAVILRMVAKIIEKHSRVNDVLGRSGNDEIGILLPHTGKRGAAIKAERLRRILESADFSKVLPAFPKITVSIGVSEYPTLTRDADELLNSADEALFTIRKIGNKTCLAQAPENHTPDFNVAEKGAV